MKFRISDNSSYATEFETEEKSFLSDLIDASHSYRLATMRKIHQGDIHKTYYYGKPGYLHIGTMDGQWFNLGEIQLTTSKLAPNVFDPYTAPVLNASNADTPEMMFREDELTVSANASHLWNMAIDTMRWVMAIDNMADEIVTDLPDESDFLTTAQAAEAKELYEELHEHETKYEEAFEEEAGEPDPEPGRPPMYASGAMTRTSVYLPDYQRDWLAKQPQNQSEVIRALIDIAMRSNP
jgi:hypothetical protein